MVLTSAANLWSADRLRHHRLTPIMRHFCSEWAERGAAMAVACHRLPNRTVFEVNKYCVVAASGMCLPPISITGALLYRHGCVAHAQPAKIYKDSQTFDDGHCTRKDRRHPSRFAFLKRGEEPILGISRVCSQGMTNQSMAYGFYHVKNYPAKPHCAPSSENRVMAQASI